MIHIIISAERFDRISYLIVVVLETLVKPHSRRVHNGVLKSRIPAYFSAIIPLSRPFLRTNRDLALILSRLSYLNIEIDVI